MLAWNGARAPLRRADCHRTFQSVDDRNAPESLRWLLLRHRVTNPELPELRFHNIATLEDPEKLLDRLPSRAERNSALPMVEKFHHYLQKTCGTR